MIQYFYALSCPNGNKFFLFKIFNFVRNDLQEEHYSSLRSEIFRHILLFSSGSRIVLTRLCIAVSQPGLLNVTIINQYRDEKIKTCSKLWPSHDYAINSLFCVKQFASFVKFFKEYSGSLLLP